MADLCPCCHGTNWFQCRCDEDCETGRRRMAEGRDSTDVEGDAAPEEPPRGRSGSAGDER